MQLKTPVNCIFVIINGYQTIKKQQLKKSSEKTNNKL
jgi:hypothetical protein